MNSNTLAMMQHEPLMRQKIDVDKYSLGTGLWFLKVFKIISGATTANETDHARTLYTGQANEFFGLLILDKKMKSLSVYHFVLSHLGL